MKKTLLFLLLFQSGWLYLTALAQEDNGFHIRFSSRDATCYNNGKVIYALTDNVGTVQNSLPPQLSQVRVYYKLSETDSAHYAGWYYDGGTDTLTINYGTYIVGVEGLLADSAGGFTRVDTQTVLTINTTYQKPTAAVVPFDAKFQRYDAGTLATISCENIGRVQLRILYGQFPYTVTVRNNSTGDTLRTQVFESRQYNGTFEAIYSYKDYYSIDSLPGGNWSFHVEDGCGYGLPDVVASVGTYTIPQATSISVFASSGNFADTNVVKISIDFQNSVSDLISFIHKYGSYRFRFDGVADGDWRPVPENATTSGRYIHLYDTIRSAEKYCDIWEHDITLEYQLSGCGTSSLNRVTRILKPNENYFAKDSMDLTDSVKIEEGGCVRVSYWHLANYSIYYHKEGASQQYSPDKYTQNGDDEFYRYHYTHPLTWVYTDTHTGAILKRDTVTVITDKSYLSSGDVRSVYGVPADSTLVIPVERRLLDGKGCELYATFDTLRFTHDTSLKTICWQVFYRDDGSRCCTSPRLVRVSRITDFGPPADGTVVRLVRSPLNNFYNFEAVYREADKSWTIVKDSVLNTAAITGSTDGSSMTVSDYCLPSGPYVFEVTTLCGTQQVGENVSFGDYMQMRLTEEIECVSERDCSNLYITYPHGAFQWIRTNTSPETGLPIDTVFQDVAMKATVVDAPAASLKKMESYNTPTFTFSMPGTYVLQVCPYISVDVCSEEVCREDTFYLDAATVEFEEALAVLCDASSTEGSAWVRAGHGIPPYTYRLYDQPDKQGNILAVNDSGVFPNIPMRSDQTLSCLVQDSCNAYFHVNFQPSVMEGLQKLWFEGGLTETTACEGSTLQIHALAIGDIWQYEWSGPNGFSATTPDPYLSVPRGSSGGWYYVSIRQTSCAGEIRDSIYLTVLPAPTLNLSPDTTICPGEVMEVQFTPHSDATSGNIHFSIAFATDDKVSIRSYSSASGVTVTDTFSTLSPTKIYPVGIHDEHCDYLLADPEDTIYIHLRTDLTDACQIITTFDTVCYGGNAHLTATVTDPEPYVLLWYGDYALTRLLKADTIVESGQWSDYDTAGILRKTLLYTSLQKGDLCPSVNGLTDSVMNMSNGETTITCGRHIRLYGGSGSGERIVHRFHTSEGTRVSIHIDEVALSGATHLLVFSGDGINGDSLLLNLTEGSAPSQTAVSTGNTLTVCVLGNMTQQSDWSAVVEAAPGIAVADVRRSNSTLFKDEVCQSQTNTYDDPYGMVPGVVSADELAQAIRKAGNYFYTMTFPGADRYGCDSIIDFHLTVNPPTVEETVATAFRQTGFLWHDSVYKESGRYERSHTDADGCDFIDVLRLTVINVTPPDTEICRGEFVTLRLPDLNADLTPPDTVRERRARPGDVLCTDGSIMPVDAFLDSGKSPMGVVFHVDETSIHGLAVALTEAERIFSFTEPYLIMSPFYFHARTAILDMEGEANTLYLKSTDDGYSGVDFATDATAASYCYYFNHNTLTADGEHHGWHLPSFAELCILQGNAWEVKQTMNRLCETSNAYKNFTFPHYWSSTFRSGTQVWMFENTNWEYYTFDTKGGVRPVMNF